MLTDSDADIDVLVKRQVETIKSKIANNQYNTQVDAKRALQPVGKMKLHTVTTAPHQHILYICYAVDARIYMHMSSYLISWLHLLHIFLSLCLCVVVVGLVLLLIVLQIVPM